MTVIGNVTVCNMLITHGIIKMASIVCREVSEMGLRRLECDRLRREINEESHVRFVNCCPCLS